MAQLVERPTEKPGATLTRVRVPGAARVFLPESAFSADSDGVRTALVCNHTHTSTSVCMLQIPNTGSRTLVWTQINTTHTGRNG